MSEKPDELLIERYVQSGELDAYGELFNRYRHLVYGLCLKYLKNEQEAYDAVMDVFEKLPDDLKNYEVSNFKSWLYSTAKNRCLMIIRHRDVQRKYSDSVKNKPDLFMDSSSETHLESIDDEKRNGLLKNALSQLKEHQQICIKLFYFDEHSYEEIEKITGFPPKKVKSYIQNGKRNLALILKTYSEFER